jgi:hypothetical protein
VLKPLSLKEFQITKMHGKPGSSIHVFINTSVFCFDDSEKTSHNCELCVFEYLYVLKYEYIASEKALCYD